MKRWLLARLEWALLVSGLGFLGICAIQTLEARRFQAQQTAIFVAARERVEADAADAAAAAVEYGGLLGMLSDLGQGIPTRGPLLIANSDTKTPRGAVVMMPVEGRPGTGAEPASGIAPKGVPPATGACAA